MSSRTTKAWPPKSRMPSPLEPAAHRVAYRSPRFFAEEADRKLVYSKAC